MPDLDTEFRDLRRVLHTTIDQPDLVDIAARARARTTRRRTQWTAMAAVLVVAVTVPFLRGDEVADAPPADQPDRSIISSNPYLGGLEFVTPERGYAIESNCLWYDSDREDCRYDLLATTDGGRSWEAHPLPPAADGKIYTRLRGWYAIGEDNVVVDRTTLDDRHERILSVDGGRTWSVVEEPTGAAPSPEISAAGGLVGDCPPTEEHCPKVATILPDGRTSPLVTQPPLTHPVPSYYPTTEGTWWVHGRDPATGELALAVSQNDGRTWTARTLGLPVDDEWAGYVSVAEYDGTLYTAVSEYRLSSPNLLTAMFLSTDGGATWTRTREYADDERPRSLAGELVVTPSGELLVDSVPDDRKTYATTDGGVTFTEAKHQFTGIVYRVQAGYVEVPWRPVKTGHAFSPDGVGWRPFTVG